MGVINLKFKGKKMSVAVENVRGKKEYDFSNKKPNEVLTDDELENFEEGVKLKNESKPADEMDFDGAVESVLEEISYILA